MASVIEACPGCGVSTTIHVGQRGGDALTWSWALHCTNCGKTIEADDRGFPPPGYRRAIIEQEGLWEVVVSEGSTSSVVALALNLGVHGVASSSGTKLARPGSTATCSARS